MSAYIYRFNRIYCVDVNGEHRGNFLSAQGAHDWLQRLYPGIPTHWNI